MKKIAVSALFALCFSSAAFAQGKTSYTCTYGALERKIYIEYTHAGKSVPCKVYYLRDTKTKDLNNPNKALRIYSYENEAGQCEAKAKEFSEKIAKMGWVCK